jgi:hypothetical protein
MNDGEQPSDTELLVEARSSSNLFGVFHELHVASVATPPRRRSR